MSATLWANDIIMMPMQGPSDYGVFATSVMTSLAYDEDPSEVKYKQCDLREHLINCFTCKQETIFPK